MRTLLTAGAVAELHSRFEKLQPDAVRRWGKMSVDGMLCHVDDAYTGLLRRDQPAPSRATWQGRYLLRPLALHVPLAWPHGVPTVPDVDQLAGGTPPANFNSDRRRLLTSLTRFAETKDFNGRPHPLFGAMSEWEWMRWGWLHPDHHLRRFGG